MTDPTHKPQPCPHCAQSMTPELAAEVKVRVKVRVRTEVEAAVRRISRMKPLDITRCQGRSGRVVQCPRWALPGERFCQRHLPPRETP